MVRRRWLPEKPLMRSRPSQVESGRRPGAGAGSGVGAFAGLAAVSVVGVAGLVAPVVVEKSASGQPAVLRW